jgi:hypothetical protein
MHPRRFATLVAALALGVLALPSAAKAEQFCYGDIAAIEATPERDTGVNQGLGRFTRASFDTDASPCARDKANRIALAAWVTVQNVNNGRLSGPFPLGKPKGCAAPAKKAKKKAKKS